jgi:hypothetical protein
MKFQQNLDTGFTKYSQSRKAFCFNLASKIFFFWLTDYYVT